MRILNSIHYPYINISLSSTNAQTSFLQLWSWWIYNERSTQHNITAKIIHKEVSNAGDCTNFLEGILSGNQFAKICIFFISWLGFKQSKISLNITSKLFFFLGISTYRKTNLTHYSWPKAISWDTRPSLQLLSLVNCCVMAVLYPLEMTLCYS